MIPVSSYPLDGYKYDTYDDEVDPIELLDYDCITGEWGVFLGWLSDIEIRFFVYVVLCCLFDYIQSSGDSFDIQYLLSIL